MAQRASIEQMISDYVNLIKACRSINPNVKIIMSATIPRPVDHEVTDPIIWKINSYFHKTLSNELKFKFICTYKPFTHAEKVRRELYAIRDGACI